MKTSRDALVDAQRRLGRVQALPQQIAPAVAEKAAGHIGSSTVSVTAVADGAQVEISGPDAAAVRSTVHQRAQAGVVAAVARA